MKPQPTWPTADQRLSVDLVDSPHPATLGVEDFTQRVDFRFQRRSGPGGQHRNKVSTGAFVLDRPTGVVAEATESRSQRTNRSEALARLRTALAIAIRTESPHDPLAASHSDETTGDTGNQPRDWAASVETAARRRVIASRLRLAATNPDRPAAIALLLNDLHPAGGQPSLITPFWDTSTSRIVTFLKSTPAAMAWVNQLRAHHGRLPLK